jgi:hypothetical protein
MSDNDIPRLQMHHPGEVAELVPYLVGFTPEESLVVIVTRNNRVEVTARVDLGDIQAPGAAEDLLDRIWDRFPDADAFLVAYTEDHPAGWDMLHRADSHLAGHADRQTMLVDHDTWELADGETGTIDHDGQIATQAVSYGLKLRPSRRDLQAAFASAPDSDQLATRIGAVLDTLPRPRDTEAILARTADLIDRNLPDQPANVTQPAQARVPLDDAIALAVLAQNPSAQSLAVLSITRENAPEHLALWRDVVNQVPAYGAEAPLYLAGMAAWVSGDGASAVVALDRSTDLNPDARPTGQVQLLSQLIDQVVPPSAWEYIRDDVLADADPRVRTALHTPAEPEVWETITPKPIRNPDPLDAPPPAPGIAI